MTEEMLLAGTDAARTSQVVASLIQYIVRSWREHFARSVAMKFNCFFLLPFIDDFPSYLRSELDKLYSKAGAGGASGGGDDGGDGHEMGDLLDVVQARKELQRDRDALVAECDANSRLQER